MDDLVEILTNVTLVIQFVVPGVIFFAIMNYISCRHREADFTRYLLSCVMVSYVSFVISSRWYSACLGELMSQILYALVGGIVFGLLQRCKWIRGLFKKVFKAGITNNIFVKIFQDAPAGEGPVVRIRLKNKDGFVFGNLVEVINEYEAPILILEEYCYYDKDMKLESATDSRGKTGRLAIEYTGIDAIEYTYAE